MPTVTVLATQPWQPTPPLFTFIGDAGTRVAVPFGPLPTEISNLANTWTTLDRAAMSSLLLFAGVPLPQLSFVLTLARPDYTASVEDYLDALRRAAASRERFAISYGPQERGLWRFTDLRIQHTTRAPGSNLVTRAQATITMTQVSAVSGVGPVTGGVGQTPKPPAVTPAPSKTPAPKPPAPAPVPTPTKQPAVQRTVRVVAGMTLWALAVKYYGNGTLWTRIAAANGIRNPRTLQIGTLIVVPVL